MQLRNMGWHVVLLWECQLKSKVREQNLKGLLYTLNKIVLENYNAKIDDKVILDRELWWKETLKTKRFGYNSN